MKSWAKFTITPWLFIIVITSISLLLSNFSPNSEILSIMVLALTAIVLVSLPYSMLVTAPKKPYLFTTIYMLSIWIVLKLMNLEDFSLNSNFFKGLISGSIATLIAMLIFYLKTKKTSQYK